MVHPTIGQAIFAVSLEIVAFSIHHTFSQTGNKNSIKYERIIHYLINVLL